MFGLCLIQRLITTRERLRFRDYEIYQRYTRENKFQFENSQEAVNFSAYSDFYTFFVLQLIKMQLYVRYNI